MLMKLIFIAILGAFIMNDYLKSAPITLNYISKESTR